MSAVSGYSPLNGIPTIGNGGECSTSINELNLYGTGTIFTQTNTTTNANSTTPTNMIGTGIGSVTLPANFWIAGRQIRVKGKGYYSTAALLPSLTFASLFGSTTLISVSIANLINSATNLGFSFDQTMTCRSTGTSGTIQVDGNITYSVGSLAPGVTYLVGLSAATVNTTVSAALINNTTWSAASASNTISVTQTSVEVLN